MSHYTLVLDMLGRPLVENAANKMHFRDRDRARGQWRDAATVLARAEGIPKGLASIHVTAQARYRTRQSPSDCDATSPSVKGVIDGLVVAGVIRDDCHPYVASVLYVAPAIGTGLADALIVTVEEAAA